MPSENKKIIKISRIDHSYKDVKSPEILNRVYQNLMEEYSLNSFNEVQDMLDAKKRYIME
ncbi:MAG: hypothetical protein IJH63_09965 [Methanobrevibacter sp.]|nr:hypothetical protein [Methanobrevibacter sp.]